MIDTDGYRQNVGVVICNHLGRVLWAKRCGQHAWQFLQGGIEHNERAEQAMARELFEEVGLRPQQVDILGSTHQWLYYRLPKRLIRRQNQSVYIGQKQKWFLLQLRGDDSCINLQTSNRPEFNEWRWVSYWYPIRYAAPFMRHIYQQILQEFASVVMPASQATLSAPHCSTEHSTIQDT